jgi:archaellum biogenesis ATPase FlaH
MQSGENNMSEKLKNTNQITTDISNTTTTGAQEKVVISPDSSICSETVNTANNTAETEEPCSVKAAEISEGVYSVADIFDMDINVSWNIAGILPVGGLMILSGLHGKGKSFLALDLSIKMTQKIPSLWLDKFKLQSGPVAYIDTENGLPLIKHRLELLGAKEENNLKIIYRPSLDINDSSDYSQLSEDLKKINPVLIIIDSLRRFYSGSENDSGNMSQVMHKIMNLHPAAKIVLHHTCKDGSKLRGSGDLSAVVDSHLQLTKTENCKSVFIHAKSRWDKAVDDFAVDWIEKNNSLEFVYGGTPDSEESCDKSEKIIQVIRDADGTLSRTEIIKRTKIPEKTIKRRLKALVEREVLSSEKKGKFMNYSLIDNQEKN